MSDRFVLGGDPDAIEASAQQWGKFGDAAGSASADIRTLDSDEFVGDEAETWRSKVNQDLPPNLDSVDEAWNVVKSALITYAGQLREHQRQLAALHQTYSDQQRKVEQARTTLSSAQQADRNETTRVQTATNALQPGETLPPSTYQSNTPSAQSSLTTAQNNLQETINAANGIKTQHNTDVRACCREIERAKGMRFAEPPGFWGRLGNAVIDWVKENAEVLKQISGVLKIISAIAGVLAFIPVLAPIMGPIALATGAAALAIDALLVMAGEGSLTDLLIDGALMLLPGAGKLLKPLIMGTKAGKAVNLAVAAGKNKAMWTAGKYAAGAKAMVKAKVPVRMPAMPRMATTPSGHNVMMMAAGNTKRVPALVGSPKAAANAFRKGADDYVPTIKINSKKYPGTASHVRDAQAGRNWRGDQMTPGGPRQPDVVTVDRTGAAARRRDSLRGVEPGKPKIDRDEYPPAMFSEGGTGSSVKYISASDNRGAGSVMGWDVRGAGLGNGDVVRIVVK